MKPTGSYGNCCGTWFIRLAYRRPCPRCRRGTYIVQTNGRRVKARHQPCLLHALIEWLTDELDGGFYGDGVLELRPWKWAGFIILRHWERHWVRLMRARGVNVGEYTWEQST